MKINAITVSALFLLLLGAAVCSEAADWPMWRYDACRTAASPTAIPETLYLQWSLVLPPPEPAWPDTQTKLQFDGSYEPVVEGDRLFVPSAVHDALIAYDTETGAELWRYRAGGPVRLAPAVANGKVYFVSDDGGLYCVDSATGALVWHFSPAPTNRKLLGNERLISMWPARGGPVVRDGMVYFTGGIWPFMGLFLCALDAETGTVVWENSAEGCRWTPQPHDTAWAFATVAPQGHIVATESQLLLSGGRSVPAAFDRGTGEFQYFDVRDRTFSKAQGGHAVGAARDWFFCGSGYTGTDSPGMYRLADGEPVLQTAASVLADTRVYDVSGGAVRALDFSGAEPALTPLWTVTPSSTVDLVFCKAGAYLYAGGAGCVIAIEDLDTSGVERWSMPILGTPTSMLAADDRLFVVTEEGHLYCFGETNTGAALPSTPYPDVVWPPEDAWTTEAQAILSETGVDAGYCLVLGLGDGRLMEELARHSSLCVIGLDPDPVKVDGLRARWEGMYIPASRLTAFQGQITSQLMQPYWASLIVTQDAVSAGISGGSAFVEPMFEVLRPYGGVACFPASTQTLFDQCATSGTLDNAESSVVGSHALLTRAGALPDSADWTHQYADAANTVMSKDQRVKAPLGMLWFGGSSNAPLLPRHGHGPSPHVVGGRLFIEGVDLLRAMDIYTGRILWEKSLPGIGDYYNYTDHLPGASHIGANFASVEDGVYVAYGQECLWLDPARGNTLDTFAVPGNETLGQVKVYEDLLILTAKPLTFDTEPIGTDTWNATCSEQLVVLDRHTGALQWARTASNSVHHNTVIACDGKICYIDRLPPGYEAALSRRGLTPKDIGAAPYALFVLDAQSGTELWSTTNAVFGTWLGYNLEHGVLLESTRSSINMVGGEPFGELRAYDTSDWSTLWHTTDGYFDQGPHILYGDRIITQMPYGGQALDLMTGESIQHTNPVTGETEQWLFYKGYGCDVAVACENLLTFRSGAAGFYDMTNEGGSSTLGGFRAGCSSNLIAAGGVLTAADYTRTCLCSYQIQTSLALIHMPDAEMWVNGVADPPGAPVKQLGFNLGAPGDRMDDRGVLWADLPGSTGRSPDLPMTTVPAEPAWYRYHSSFFADDDNPWLAASGVRGLESLSLDLGTTEETFYTVRLLFAEPDLDRVEGERVFSVALQGREVLSDFDIVQSAGAPRRTIVTEFTRVRVNGELSVSMTAAKSLETILCGIEALMDSDGDQFADMTEEQLGTDAERADTDGDGLTDYEEIWFDGDAGYDPFDPVANPVGTDTNANNADSDGDGVSDGLEVRLGTDPLDISDVPEAPLARWAMWAVFLSFLALGIALLAWRRRNAISV